MTSGVSPGVAISARRCEAIGSGTLRTSATAPPACRAASTRRTAANATTAFYRDRKSGQTTVIPIGRAYRADGTSADSAQHGH